jgi:hypothetical protein
MSDERKREAQRERDRKPCVQCGSREPKPHGTRCCSTCRDAVHEAALAHARAVRVKARKPCQRCGRPKGPGKRRRFCDACRAQAAPSLPPCQGCGERPVRAKRKRYCWVCTEIAQRAKRRYRRQRQRRIRSTPQGRENTRRWSHEYRERAKARQAHEESLRRRGHDPAPKRVTAAPLGAAVRRAVAHRERAEVAALAGVSDRMIYALEYGEREMVETPIAEMILDALGLMWWEVWHRDLGVPDAACEHAARAFAGLAPLTLVAA